MAAICPRCSVPLNHGRLGPAEVDLCPDCRGTLVEQKRLMGLVEWMAGELLQGLDLDQEIEFVENPGAVGACPACGAAMERSGYMNMPQVLIDRCLSCRAVWLDVGELGAMSLIYARTERRSTERKRVMKEASAPLIALQGEAEPDQWRGRDGGLTVVFVAEAVIRLGFVFA